MLWESFRAAAKNKSSSGEDALEAFSKIDKKNENLFTQEDRKNKFKNSIVRNLDKKESLSKNVSTMVMDQHHPKKIIVPTTKNPKRILKLRK